MPIFPKNNLPTASLNWGREVEKSINNLESSFRTAEVNNVSRDAQLQASYKRLDTTVTQLAATNAAVDQAQSDSIAALQAAQTATTTATTANTNALNALQDIIDLGSPGGPAINANNITAGTLTGITVQTGSSGTRVKASGTNIEFYSSAYAGGGSRVGYIQGDDMGSPGLYMISDQGEIGIDATSITLSGDTTVTGELAVNGSFSPSSVDTGSITGTGLTINGNASVTGTLSAGTFNPSSISTGSITASSVAVGTSNIGSNFINAESVGGGNASFTGSVTGQSGIISNSVLTRTELSGGGTTGASITNGGNFVRTTSSQRYKTDIEPLQINLQDLYQVEPKTFKRIDEVEEDPETARTYPGFIAEELAGTSLDKFVFYSKDENGNSRPEGIHYPELTAALLLAIKDLNARLTSLEDRVQ